MIKFKPLLTFLLVLAVLVVAYFASLYLADKAKEKEMSQAGQSNTNVDQLQATTQTYDNSEEKYSFTYPSTLKDGMEDITYAPYDTGNAETDKYVVDKSLLHESNSEYCAPIGECTPTTRDFVLNAAVIESSIARIKNSIATSEVKTERIGQYTVLTTTQGVEGEGLIWYFVALPSGRTLMFTQKYMDESVMSKYKSVKDFIPFKEQNRITREIISSLIFTK